MESVEEAKYPVYRAHRERAALKIPRAVRAKEPFRVQAESAMAQVGAAGWQPVTAAGVCQNPSKKQIRWHHGARLSS